MIKLTFFVVHAFKSDDDNDYDGEWKKEREKKECTKLGVRCIWNGGPCVGVGIIYYNLESSLLWLMLSSKVSFCCRLTIVIVIAHRDSCAQEAFKRNNWIRLAINNNKSFGSTVKSAKKKTKLVCDMKLHAIKLLNHFSIELFQDNDKLQSNFLFDGIFYRKISH